MSKQKRCSFLISFDSGCAVACVRQPKCWQTGRRLRLRFASADVVRAAMCGALLVCVCVFAFSSLSLSALFRPISFGCATQPQRCMPLALILEP